MNDDKFYAEATWIAKRNYGYEYPELKKKKIPGSLNLGVTLRDKSGCIITEWEQNFAVRKGGVVDGIQIYVLDGHFICFLAEDTVKLATDDGFDEEEELEDLEEVLKDGKKENAL